jgi:hypothetical protein
MSAFRKWHFIVCPFYQWNAGVTGELFTRCGSSIESTNQQWSAHRSRYPLSHVLDFGAAVQTMKSRTSLFLGYVGFLMQVTQTAQHGSNISWKVMSSLIISSWQTSNVSVLVQRSLCHFDGHSADNLQLLLTPNASTMLDNMNRRDERVLTHWVYLMPSWSA